jgi:hypothetical protein
MLIEGGVAGRQTPQTNAEIQTDSNKKLKTTAEESIG